MKFIETGLKDAWVLEPEPIEDDRGFFARAFCARELEEHGLDPTVAQCNISTNHRRGTLRGMHYQVPPATETKLIRCTKGTIYDAIIDLRPDSPTYREHFCIELSAENRKQLFVPGMFAHGYLTLTDETEVFYMVSEFYTPGLERGLRWDDPAFGIAWPLEPTLMSEKDAAWAPWTPDEGAGG